MPRPRAGINEKGRHMSTTETLDAAATCEPPAAPAVKLRDPDREVRRGRGINYEWEISNDGEAGVRLAVLSIIHVTAGRNLLGGVAQPNHFAATLRNQWEQKRPGRIVTRGFALFSGEVIASEEVSRFSQKRQDTFAKAALEKLRERFEQQHPDVVAYFSTQA
jgi:hypothetical protein